MAVVVACNRQIINSQEYSPVMVVQNGQSATFKILGPNGSGVSKNPREYHGGMIGIAATCVGRQQEQNAQHEIEEGKEKKRKATQERKI